MTADRHHEAEQRIRAAMDQLRSGQVAEGSKCDSKSLCVLAGVARATFYRAYPNLKAEFEQRLGPLRDNGEQPDHRLAQPERLKAEVIGLRERLSRSDRAIADLERFRSNALSRLAAQHDEIAGLRRQLEAAQSPRLRTVTLK